ncbi:hypothetical protein TRFO_33442 [Tritrichomonas foetus]|uniref:Myb-like DNA-binding domain containing protein n=1 Tax=Tritrichomonas foetus TaxID=1144522 RepID=A0A1J4JNG9_9EUKA|nr:hypothetical protein TRFO_33442 [Tritrichomonas foetus]|eukprot:OHS99983.1 hypothetical protein TRFO_33442 [Tritrichomonas foetus]
MNTNHLSPETSSAESQVSICPDTSSAGGNSNPALRRKFTEEEDRFLSQLVAEMGPRKWDQIAKRMPNRTARQCRDRYSNYLIPGFFNGEWSREEDELLYSKYQEFGPKWAIIKEFFKNRSPNSIKNRWNYFVSRAEFSPKSASQDSPVQKPQQSNNQPIQSHLPNQAIQNIQNAQNMQGMIAVPMVNSMADIANPLMNFCIGNISNIGFFVQQYQIQQQMQSQPQQISLYNYNLQSLQNMGYGLIQKVESDSIQNTHIVSNTHEEIVDNDQINYQFSFQDDEEIDKEVNWDDQQNDLEEEEEDEEFDKAVYEQSQPVFNVDIGNKNAAFTEEEAEVYDFLQFNFDESELFSF